MGNQNKKTIEIPQTQITTYFKIFHQTKTAVMLLELKKLSMIDLNHSCKKLLGINTKSNFNKTPFEFCPSVQSMYQNKASDMVFREQIELLKEKNGLSEFYFEWKNKKGEPFKTFLCLRSVSIWGNSLLQIMITHLKQETNKNNLKSKDYVFKSDDTKEINDKSQGVELNDNL
ncbi:hypothetical protein M0813_20898 [Anaeramoeba flamelloides]|uniref:Uncharacterized protein n=1 Tax=Anaeramoeba flamelloides TaxID=1746091 RepID=A0AAV7Z677_9EUKA|nr:hypothetical protein M0812_02290 [Anaeramoeba flamelloides]KAJ6244807.1 hypothetical protein M0813_20898 [Anaeramoeba flamelloides]